VQDVPVVFNEELFVHTTNDPDCAAGDVHCGYTGAGGVREVEFFEIVVDDGDDVGVVVEGDVGVGVEVGITGAADGVVGGLSTAHIEEIILRAVLAREAAQDVSKHELESGLKVAQWHAHSKSAAAQPH